MKGTRRDRNFYRCIYDEGEDQHAEPGNPDRVYNRGHYDRFFPRDSLQAQLGPGFEVRDPRRLEDGDHVFLNVLLHRESA